MVKAVFKDDAVRCEKCGVEIWEGVDCDCGIDGVDHEGLKEAYEEKTKAGIEIWSEQDAEQLKALRRKQARHIRDKNRQRKYSPKKRSVV